MRTPPWAPWRRGLVVLGLVGLGSGRGWLGAADAPVAPPAAPTPTPASASRPAFLNPALAKLPAFEWITPPDEEQTLAGFRLEVETEKATVERVAVEGEPFRHALRVTVKERGTQPYLVRLAAYNTVPLKEGDVLWLTVRLRGWRPGVAGTEAAAGFVFKNAQPPFDPSWHSVQFNRFLSESWTLVEMPFRCKRDYAPGEAHLYFALGAQSQVVEIGGFAVLRFPPSVALEQLPQEIVKVGYEGREADAPWRAEAAARIDKHRKADLKIRVVDARNRPLPDFALDVAMTRHKFLFGTAVDAGTLMEPKNAADGERYREAVEKYFNHVVLENDLKWWMWQQRGTRKRTLAAIDWLNERGISVHGHVLVWPGWQHMRDLEPLADNPAALRQRLEAHINDIMRATRGKLVSWDVVNETRGNIDVTQALGPQSLVDWFKIARRNDPKVGLYINEVGAETGGGRNRSSQDIYFETIERLRAAGAPVTGIGFQSHFSNDPTPPAALMPIFDRFAATGLDLKVTEYDFVTWGEGSGPEIEADYLRDYLTLVFSHPKMEGFIMWGFWDGMHWKKNAPLFTKDWQLKPSGAVWEDLVYRQWWTKEVVRTDAAGTGAVRGFLGRYAVRPEGDPQAKPVEFDLVAPATELTLRWDGRTLTRVESR